MGGLNERQNTKGAENMAGVRIRSGRRCRLVDQTKMNAPASNGSDGKSRGVAANLAHFLRDLVALFELQGLLLVVEAGDEFRKARFRLMLIIGLAAVGLSCFPI